MYEDQYTASLREIIEYSKLQEDAEVVSFLYEWMCFLYEMNLRVRENPLMEPTLGEELSTKGVTLYWKLRAINSEDTVLLIDQSGNQLLHSFSYQEPIYITLLMIEQMRTVFPRLPEFPVKELPPEEEASAENNDSSSPRGVEKIAHSLIRSITSFIS